MDERELAERMAGTFEAFSIILLNAADETRKDVKSENGKPIGLAYNAVRVMTAMDSAAELLDDVVTALKGKHGASITANIMDTKSVEGQYANWLAEYDANVVSERSTFYQKNKEKQK